MSIINKLTLWAAKDSRNEVSKMVLELIEERENLKKQLDNFKIAAYARINDRGDLFDLRLQNNPYVDQNTVVPLYFKYE